MPSRRTFLKAVGGAAVGGATAVELHPDTDLKKFLDRNSVKFALNPEAHLNPTATAHLGSLWNFISDFDYEPDELAGLYDISRRVAHSVQTGRGDCTDAAAVVLSWFTHHRPDFTPTLCVYAPTDIGYGHMAVKGEQALYDQYGMTFQPPEAPEWDDLQLYYTTEVDMEYTPAEADPKQVRPKALPESGRRGARPLEKETTEAEWRTETGEGQSPPADDSLPESAAQSPPSRVDDPRL